MLASRTLAKPERRTGWIAAAGRGVRLEPRIGLAVHRGTRRVSCFGSAAPRGRPPCGRLWAGWLLGALAQHRVAKIAKKSESRGEIGPFAAWFSLVGLCLSAVGNRLLKETPGQACVSLYATSELLIECPKISPRFPNLVSFRPIYVRGMLRERGNSGTPASRTPLPSHNARRRQVLRSPPPCLRSELIVRLQLLHGKAEAAGEDDETCNVDSSGNHGITPLIGLRSLPKR